MLFNWNILRREMSWIITVKKMMKKSFWRIHRDWPWKGWGRCVVMGSLAGKSAEWFQKSSLRKFKHTYGQKQKLMIFNPFTAKMFIENDREKCKIWNPSAFLFSFLNQYVKGFHQNAQPSKWIWYWAVQWSWFAQGNALCNLSRKKSWEVAASLPGWFLSRCCFSCV